MGRSKACLPIGPESMLARVVRIVGEVAMPIIVVASPGQELPELPGEILVVRDPTPDLGPLQGIATGLAALPESTEFAFVASTDVPFLHPDWITHLHRAIGDRDLAVADVGGYLHPLVALYRRGPALEAARVLLGESARRALDLVGRLDSIVLDQRSMAEVDPDLGTLINLNTPGDYRQALRATGHRIGPDD